VTLEASAYPGYAIVNWHENSNVLSTFPIYTLTSDTNHTIVANFIAAASTTPAQPSLSLAMVSPGLLILPWPTNSTVFAGTEF
jgi:hypothetical protein